MMSLLSVPFFLRMSPEAGAEVSGRPAGGKVFEKVGLILLTHCHPGAGRDPPSTRTNGRKVGPGRSLSSSRDDVRLIRQFPTARTGSRIPPSWRRISRA